jgi:hypothetical protein
MTDPVDPIRGLSRAEAARRRNRQRRAAAAAEAAESDNLPVPAGDARTHPPEPPPAADAAFAAQLLAGAPRRGLKGGPETLERARATYLGTEYSGAHDRRPRKGRIAKTEI